MGRDRLLPRSEARGEEPTSGAHDDPLPSKDPGMHRVERAGADVPFDHIVAVAGLQEVRPRQQTEGS